MALRHIRRLGDEGGDAEKLLDVLLKGWRQPDLTVELRVQSRL